ncbi:MAG: alpha/beta hydrolase [Phenylobacterium zucineum]|nr:MAG: alpha/beta hydrolase [Phenylobacterium zucineum]
MTSTDNRALRPYEIAIPQRGGVTSAYEVGPGDRPVDIVFSHANGFNARTYRSILEPLTDTLRVLMVDQRGHGGSRLPADADKPRDSWRDVGDDLTAVLDTLDLKNVILAGHSMGGASSLLAAAARPHRVRALALFDPVIMSPEILAHIDRGSLNDSPLAVGARKRRPSFASKAAAVEAYRGRGAFRTWSEAMLIDYVEDGFVETPAGDVTLTCAPAWEASNFTAQGHEPYAAFDALDIPIRILRAEVGSTCRLEGPEAILTRSGKVQVEMVPGTSHFLPMERSDLVVEVLRRLSSAIG